MRYSNFSLQLITFVLDIEAIIMTCGFGTILFGLKFDLAKQTYIDPMLVMANERCGQNVTVYVERDYRKTFPKAMNF